MRREVTASRRSLDSERLTAIFKLLEGETHFNLHNRALIDLMVDSGLRAFEVCHLQTRHLYLKTNSCKAEPGKTRYLAM
jgi:site-specific recombinase XerC